VLPGSVGNMLVQGILLALGLFSGIVTARHMGPAQRGALSFLVLVPTMLAIFGTVGMEYAAYYLWHQDCGKLRPQLLAVTGVVGSLSGLAFGAVGFVVVARIEPGTWLLLQFLVVTSVPFGIANTILTMILMAEGKLTGYNVSRLVGPASYTGAVAVLWINGALSVASAFLAWVCSLVLTVIADLFLVARLRSGTPRWSAVVARRSVGYGIRSHVGTVAQYGTLRLDQVLLAALAGNGALGLYYAAVSIAETLLQLANNIGAAMMAQLGGRPREDQRRLAVITMGVVGIGTAAAAALLTIYGGAVISLLLGKAYLPGLSALRILLPGVVLLAVARVMNGYFIAVGEAHVFARAAVGSLIVTVVGDLLLIPVLRGSGAAVASSVAYGLMAVWLALVFRVDARRVGSAASAVNVLSTGKGTRRLSA